MAQPYRGERKPVTMRVPVAILEQVDREAARAGLRRGDYITRALALQHGLDVPQYIHAAAPDSQPQLPDQEARMSA